MQYDSSDVLNGVRLMSVFYDVQKKERCEQGGEPNTNGEKNHLP